MVEDLKKGQPESTSWIRRKDAIQKLKTLIRLGRPPDSEDFDGLRLHVRFVVF
jgi:hypothetical protein